MRFSPIVLTMLLLVSTIVASCGQHGLSSLIDQFHYTRPSSNGMESLSSDQYQKLLEEVDALLITPRTQEEFAVNEALILGKKNAFWLSLINRDRQSRGLSPLIIRINMLQGRGTPEAPFTYGPAETFSSMNAIKRDIPGDFRAIYFGSNRYPLVADHRLGAWLEWATTIDRTFQLAARWRTAIYPNTTRYSQEAKRDIRGYLFLSKRSNLKSDLEHFNDFPFEEQNRIQSQILSLCLNNDYTTAHCQDLFRTFHNTDRLYVLVQILMPKAQEVYRSYFQAKKAPYPIAVTSTNGQSILNIPIYPTPVDFFSFVQSSVDRMWRNTSMNSAMRIQVVPAASGFAPRLVSDSRVLVPNVNQVEAILYWGTSYRSDDLDAVRSVAHEFGHLLGFPDCYAEFLDPASSSVVYYSIDKTNIMCDPNGRVTDEHWNELNRLYGL